MDDSTLIRIRLLNDLSELFDNIAREMRSHPEIGIEDAGALVSAACREFATRWEGMTLQRKAHTPGRLKLVVRAEGA